MGRQQVARPIKFCATCNEQFFPPVYANGFTECSSAFTQRKFCSRACSAQSIKKTVKPKQCIVCNQTIQKWSRESIQDYLQRKYCSHKCHGKDMQLPEGPIHGGLPHRGRGIARRKKPRVECEACGATRRLEVHHKDEDPTNNEMSNLRVLCLKCHRKEHKTENCSIPGCERPFKALGYCNMHYHRFKKHGDPFLKCVNNKGPFRSTD